MKKLLISTMALFFKLVDVQKHLRDCTEDIQLFARYLASRLDLGDNRADMDASDFLHEWKTALCSLAAGQDLKTDKKVDHVLASAGVERIEALDQKMLWFAEDLCGKEFAAEVMNQSANWTVIDRKRAGEIRSGITAECLQKEAREIADELGLEHEVSPRTSPDCHPFAPEKPIVEQEAEQPLPRDPGFHRLGERLPDIDDPHDLSEVERISPPPGSEFGGHQEWP